VEIIESEGGVAKPPVKAGRGRRMDALDLSELKGEMGTGGSSKN
jgi:hypothetical protein